MSIPPTVKTLPVFPPPPLPRALGAPISSRPPPNPPNLVPPSPYPSPPTKSKAIVGGVVAGSLTIIAVAAFLFFLFRKWRTKATQGHHSEALAAYKAKFGDTDDSLGSLFDTRPALGDGKFPTSSGSSTSLSSQSITSNSIVTTLTYEELAEATDGFSEANLLGGGGFGYVYKGVLDGKLVAVKKLKAGSFQGEREFQSEVEIISRIHHRNLVSLVGYSIQGSERLLVYEFVANDSLAFHLHASEATLLSWETRMQIAIESAKAFAYLHEDCHPKIIHRDIKAHNILLDSNIKPKVSDFGLAKFVADADTHVTTRVMGTLGYLAPEYASSGKLTEKSDVYSFGIVLLELISGRKPLDLVDWARPLLDQALEHGRYEDIVDVKLKSYNNAEMSSMIVCAQACIRPFADLRPQMIQIARVLEGVISPGELQLRPMANLAA